MLIAISGTPCSGKTVLAAYLTEQHSFKSIRLVPGLSLSEDRDSLSETINLLSLKNDTSNGEESDHASLSAAASNDLVFDSPIEAMNFLMLENRWMDNYVMYPFTPEFGSQLQELKKRPFFLLVSIDAPILIRFERFCQKHPFSLLAKDLASFVQYNDEYVYTGITDSHPDLSKSTNLVGHTYLSAQTDLQILNPYQDLKSFFKYLMSSSDIVNYERCRPTWDTYFIKLCEWSSRRSNCKCSTIHQCVYLCVRLIWNVF